MNATVLTGCYLIVCKGLFADLDAVLGGAVHRLEGWLGDKPEYGEHRGR